MVCKYPILVVIICSTWKVPEWGAARKTSIALRAFAHHRTLCGFRVPGFRSRCVTLAMGGGDYDGGKVAAGAAKRRRVESLDRRLAAGKGGGVSTKPIAASAKQSGGRGGRDGEHISKHGGRSGGRGGVRDGHQKRDRNPSWKDTARPVQSQSNPPDDEKHTSAPNADAGWYVPLSHRTIAGVIAAAHDKAVPQGLRDSSKDSSKDELLAQKLTRVAYVEDQMRKFAATNPKAGADVERVVRQKTKDKVVLLDAANAFAESDKHKKKDSNARSRQDASIPSEARLRTIGVRGALQNSQALYANFAPMRDAFRDYVNETMRGLGDDDSVDDTRLQYEAQRKISEKNLNEIRGAVVSVSASRNSSLVGRKGVVARATATSIFLVTENNSIVAVPRKGSLFNLDLTLGKMKRNCKVIVKGEDACV